MDGAEVGVLEETNQVSLAGLLKSHYGRALESQVSLEVLSNFTNQPLERQLADQQLRRFLVPGGECEIGSNYNRIVLNLLISRRATVPGL